MPNHIYIYIHKEIYIYREREREREIECNKHNMNTGSLRFTMHIWVLFEAGVVGAMFWLGLRLGWVYLGMS